MAIGDKVLAKKGRVLEKTVRPDGTHWVRVEWHGIEPHPPPWVELTAVEFRKVHVGEEQIEMY
jgi:hypothetical protein